jgi:lysophospholipase L1-like esterase
VRLRRFIRHAGRLVLVGAGLVVLLLGFAEASLQVAALFVHDRATAWRPEARYRVLCVGDSHTFGFMVPSNETYPAYLQQFLDAQAAGMYSVINLGIPGMNTAQVRNRLAAQIAKYRPDTVIVWCGANNTWNRAEATADSRPSTWLSDVLNASRLYRFVRVGIHDLRLERDLRTVGQDLRGTVSGRVTRAPEDTVDDPWSTNATHTIRHWDGSTDRVSHQAGENLPESAAEEQAVGDFTTMAQDARTAGVKLVFIKYPTQLSAFAFANRAVARVGEQTGVAVVDAAVSLRRVPPDERKWLPAAHPSGPIYREIARDVAAVITRQDGTTSDADPQAHASSLSDLAVRSDPTGSGPAERTPGAAPTAP